MLHELQKEFENPGSEFRGKPFWAWNSKLEPAELRRQIRLMKRMGLGGFFMHARVGLNTAYLSDDWFACVRACLDEAKKQGMQAWAYDEDRWPSGAAGGLVTQNRALRMRRLRVDVVPAADFARGKDTLAAFAGQVEGAAAKGLRFLGPKDAPAKGESVIRFQAIESEESDWYNGQTYLDTMNKDAVAEFLKATHEAYRREVGKDFGKTMPGIFTDEPNHGGCDFRTPTRSEFPWTPSFPAEFKRRYGYDLLPRLAEVFFDVEGAGLQVRWHFHDCATALFVEAYSQQIGEWCGKNHMLSTGHVLEEDTLASQANIVGACMRHYEHMQAPGMDLLTERWQVFATAKQVSSMAHQFGKKWRLSETYGCTGWDFPFLGHKALGDWQAALGINIRCQHLAWYTMLGEAKRDYPASIFYQSSWWREYAKVEDYFARVFSVITRGEEVRDVLVVHPVESAWLKITMQKWRDRPDLKELDAQFRQVTERLLADNLDFDYGDEEVMARHAKVAKDKGGAALHVGKGVYRAVVVPAMDTMRGTTLELLRQFRAAGGAVVFAAAPAAMVDALPSAAVADFARECAQAPIPGLAKALAPFRRVSIADEKGAEIPPALYMLREDAEAFYLFVCNAGVDFTASGSVFSMPMARDRQLGFSEVTVRAGGDLGACAGAAVECRAEAGDFVAAQATRKNGALEIRTSLPPLGSRLFIVPKKAGALKAAPAPAAPAPRKAQDLGQEYDYALSEANVLALDWPEYSIDGGKKQAAEILQADDAVRAALGVKPRGGGMRQPWVRGLVKNPRRVAVALDYRFDVADMPSGDLHLCLEKPESFQAFVNDVEIPMDMDCGWWCDVSLRQFAVPPSALRLGENHLRLVCDYDENHPGLEMVYLRGNFAVRGQDKVPTLAALPAELRLGDWTAQGLPFYAGNVTYRQEVDLALGKKERALLLLGEWRGAAVRVKVNGAEAGVIAWAPFALEITKLLRPGANLIEMEVLGHHRNSHGPLHMKDSWPVWTGPGQFHECARRGYDLVPCGLLGEPQIIVAD